MIKKISLFTFLLILVLACSKEEAEVKKKEVPTTINEAPSVPVLTSPANDLACSYSTLSFEWQASTDSQGQNINYQLEISESDNFNEFYYKHKITSTVVSVDLEKGQTYYWRVQAIDSENMVSDYSEVRSFFTEPKIEYNSIPKTPSNINPSDNSVLNENMVRLEWNSEDADGDDLKFDVYLSNFETPEIVSQDQSENFIEVNLDTNDDYYWKVVVKDSKGSKAESPTWTFSIE